MELTRTSLVVSTNRMVAAEVGEEIIMLHLESGLYFGLEGVGVRVWNLLQEPTTLADIARVLVEEYEVETEDCHRELIRLVSDLLAERLVEVRA